MKYIVLFRSLDKRAFVFQCLVPPTPNFRVTCQSPSEGKRILKPSISEIPDHSTNLFLSYLLFFYSFIKQKKKELWSNMHLLTKIHHLTERQANRFLPWIEKLDKNLHLYFFNCHFNFLMPVYDLIWIFFCSFFILYH